MAKNKPLKIWITKHIPNKEPKFHQAEREEGDGRSTKDFPKIFNKG
jgi:hypothetical protein